MADMNDANPQPRKSLAPAARRALEEAAARRAAIEARVAAMPREFGGRGGEEPVRYGDWEIKGIASDF
ncbi:DUF1674 domain-containing protein [Mesorhizobium sp. ASY16-5R]|uniref:DUF1674 domain-containing protein n=1 Tax=Mesorhizobium sp. ASY16-5R TaxID=3445772 RepID=UPI003FA013B5